MEPAIARKQQTQSSKTHQKDNRTRGDSPAKREMHGQYGELSHVGAALP